MRRAIWRAGLAGLAGLALGLGCGGCLNPAKLPVTERDLEEYGEGLRVELPEVERHAVGVTVEVTGAGGVVPLELMWAQGEGFRRDLAGAAGGGIRDALAGLEMFEVAPGTTEGAWMAYVKLGMVRLEERMEEELETRERWVTDLDAPRGPGGRRPRHRELVEEMVWKRWYGASVAMDWMLCDESGRVLCSGRETARSEDDHERPDEGSLARELEASVREAAWRFGLAAGRAFAPVTRVEETRGKGRVAWIPAGGGRGYSKGTRVEFFEAGEGGAGRTVARGTVHTDEGRGAWIEVDHWKKAGVTRGHLVRTAE